MIFVTKIPIKLKPLCIKILVWLWQVPVNENLGKALIKSSGNFFMNLIHKLIITDNCVLSRKELHARKDVLEE